MREEEKNLTKSVFVGVATQIFFLSCFVAGERFAAVNSSLLLRFLYIRCPGAAPCGSGTRGCFLPPESAPRISLRSKRGKTITAGTFLYRS